MTRMQSSITPNTPQALDHAQKAANVRAQQGLQAAQMQQQQQLAQQKMQQDAVLTREAMDERRFGALLQAENYNKLNQMKGDIARMQDQTRRDAMAQAQQANDRDFNLKKSQYEEVMRLRKDSMRMQWELETAETPNPRNRLLADQMQIDLIEKTTRLKEAELIQQGRENEIPRLRPHLYNAINEKITAIDSQVDGFIAGASEVLGFVSPMEILPESNETSFSVLDAITPDSFQAGVSGIFDGVTMNAFAPEGRISPEEARQFMYLQDPNNRQKFGEELLTQALTSGLKNLRIKRPEAAGEAIKAAVDSLRSDNADLEVVGGTLNRALTEAGVDPQAFGEMVSRLRSQIDNPEDNLERTTLIGLGEAETDSLSADRVYDYFRAVGETGMLNSLKRLNVATEDMSPYRAWLATSMGGEENPFGIDQARALMENQEFRDAFGDDGDVIALFEALEGIDTGRQDMVRARSAVEAFEELAKFESGMVGRREDEEIDARKADIRRKYAELLR